jgi:ribosomal protein S18 acetylase RimI-like enzyme
MAKLKVLIANQTHFEDMIKIDHSLKSNYAYRMLTNHEKTNFAFNFQRVKLPREAHLSYMRDKESLLQSWNEASVIYAGMLDDVLVAYTTVDSKRLPKTARVSNLVVMPELRHRGIGKTMLAAIESWTAKNKLDRILLEIAMRNYPMIEMSLQSGYEICGFMEQYFPNGDPALFFQKRLA